MSQPIERNGDEAMALFPIALHDSAKHIHHITPYIASTEQNARDYCAQLNATAPKGGRYVYLKTHLLEN